MRAHVPHAQSAAGCLQTLLDAVDEVGGRFLLTADHGNAEEMHQHNKKTGKVTMDKHGKPAVLTSHTLNPVRESCLQGTSAMGKVVSDPSYPRLPRVTRHSWDAVHTMRREARFYRPMCGC